ncbi:uncharacterized protein SPPG_08813 [Spizellomyces punctatus DAOM BR117]|uniref:Uncharacterized protein n=1 Tax=Spizellomyces punctatus (strain DAOM BR117) TaxID=645134 RepID=A0A0L0HSF9_SPIPD|nr:uncharacterized protein SPPG_08813 [Spizellomyces punctatus DAOM BR117]KND04291.1 hypothetical protein SPPG_08813 [Spizellomyces punctatus DAOM BR117]|eukprot:XP_016612330.1 hypothetical protein SPPG_08813 [Spizellomyces punctatus DAOM BR117]
MKSFTAFVIAAVALLAAPMVSAEGRCPPGQMEVFEGGLFPKFKECRDAEVFCRGTQAVQSGKQTLDACIKRALGK